MECFNSPTRIFSGKSAEILEQLDCGPTLLVADPYFVKNGTAHRLMEKIPKWQLFDRVEPDPTVTLAAQGTAVVKEFAPQSIVALGGGSAIDLAKAMAYFSPQPVRLIAIPTTSGSGSEVTNFAILTHNGVKQPLVDDKLLPYGAILDESLLQQLPAKLVADTGFDVLAHALEAWASTKAGFVSDALAKEAYCLAFANLSASYGGVLSVRMKLHQASCLAGMAFSQAGLGLCHAMSHALGGMFHVPHGRLNAILLPETVSCNATAAQEKYARLARAAGLTGATDTLTVRNLKNGLLRLRRELHLPQTLQQAGIDPRAVRQRSRELVQAILEDPCCHTNPVPVEDFTVRRILEEVTGRV